MMRDEAAVDAFTEFVQRVERQLRTALIPILGLDTARDAATDALAHGWEHWDRVCWMANPASYLYQIALTADGPVARSTAAFPRVRSREIPIVEPGLPGALSLMSDAQRSAVWLVHRLRWRPTDVGELLAVSSDSVHADADQGLAKLRSVLEGRLVTDVDAQLRAYVRYVGSLSSPVVLDEVLRDHLESAEPVSAVAAEKKVGESVGDESTLRKSRRRWVSLAAVAAAIVVAAGVVVADDPFSSHQWSRLPRDEAELGLAGFQTVGDVTVGGPALVAVGSDGSDAAVWSSVDGLTWLRVDDIEEVFGGIASQVMSSVAVGRTGLVAVGVDGSEGDSDAAVWTSVDGLTWSRVGHDEEVFGGEGDQVMSSVAVGGPGTGGGGFRDVGWREDGRRRCCGVDLS